MKKKIITALMVAGLIAMSVVPSFAVENELIYLGTGQSWVMARSSVPNSGDYSYVLAKCDSVYPENGTDNITQIYVRIMDSDHRGISENSYDVLTEGEVESHINIRQGWISSSPIYFEFRGIASVSSFAVVDYGTVD